MRKIGKAPRVDDKRKGTHPRSIPEPQQPKKAKKVPQRPPKQFKSKRG